MHPTIVQRPAVVLLWLHAFFRHSQHESLFVLFHSSGSASLSLTNERLDPATSTDIVSLHFFTFSNKPRAACIHPGSRTLLAAVVEVPQSQLQKVLM